jgi:hypothetical protein
MVIKYWKAVHKRALKEARHALWIETGERAVIAIAVIGLSIVLRVFGCGPMTLKAAQ